MRTITSHSVESQLISTAQQEQAQPQFPAQIGDTVGQGFQESSIKFWNLEQLHLVREKLQRVNPDFKKSAPRVHA